jgi:hypothetical protein
MTSLDFHEHHIKSWNGRRVPELESTSQLLSQIDFGKDTEFFVLLQEQCHYTALGI